MWAKLALAGGLFTFAVTAAGCGGANAPSSPDPANYVLHRLETDTFVRTLPPDAHRLEQPIWSPATWNGTRWDCPCFNITFFDPDAASVVFSFFGAQATTSGWSAVSQMLPNGGGEMQIWEKRVCQANVVVNLASDFDEITDKHSPQDFTLFGEDGSQIRAVCQNQGS